MYSSRLSYRLLALGCLFTLLAIPSANARKQTERVARNFLPPVALINNTLTLDDLEGKKASATEDNLGPIVFSAVSPATVKLSDRPAALQSSIQVSQTNEHDTLIGLQQKVDERDLKRLWDATVEQNPVIRFSLEKLALPIDLQPKHSSRFLNKTLAAMLNGAAMGMMMAMPGAGAYQNMGVATAAQAAQNVILGNNKPQQTSGLTATEQIQLAGLIDDLKSDLVQNYQSYKKTLEQLAQARAVSLKNNNLYSVALRSPNPLARMAAASAYYKAMMNETEIRQKALVYRLKLERMAGKEAVTNLQLALLVTPQTTEVATNTTTPLAAGTPKTTTTIKQPEKPTTSTVNDTSEMIGPELSVLPTPKDTIGPETPTTSKAFSKKTAYKTPLAPTAEPSFNDPPPVPRAPNDQRGGY